MAVKKKLRTQLPALQKVAETCFREALDLLFKDYPDHNFKCIALLASESLSLFGLCGWSNESMLTKAKDQSAKQNIPVEDLLNPYVWLIGDWEIFSLYEDLFAPLENYVTEVMDELNLDDSDDWNDCSDAILLTIAKGMNEVRKHSKLGKQKGEKTTSLLLHLGNMSEAQLLRYAKVCNSSSVYRYLELLYSPAFKGKWEPLGSRRVYSTQWCGYAEGRLYSGNFRDIFVWSWPEKKEIYRNTYFPKQCVSFSMHPDGKSLWISWCGNQNYGVTVGEPGWVEPAGVYRLFLSTGEIREYFDVHGSESCRLCVSPDGASVVVGEENGAVWVWDIETGQGKQLTKVDDTVRQIRFDHSGRYVAVSGWRKSVRVYEWESGSEIWRDEIGSLYLQYSPKGTYLIQAGLEPDDNTCIIREARTGEIIRKLVFPGEFIRVDGAAFNSDESRLVLARYGDSAATEFTQGFCALYSWPQMEEIERLVAGHESIGDVFFLSEDTIAVSGHFGDGPPLILWKLESVNRSS